MVISKTPVVSSGEANVKVASHLSNFPAMFTDAFTSNLIVLSTGVISKTGACARLNDGNIANAKRHRTAVRKNFLPTEELRYNAGIAEVIARRHGRLLSEMTCCGRQSRDGPIRRMRRGARGISR